MANTKRCASCKLYLSHDHFWKSRQASDGLQPYCKKCSNKKNDHQTRLARAKKQVVAKRCPRCDEVKQPNEFHRNKANSDGLQTYCKPCMLAYSKEHASSPEIKARGCRAHGLRRFGLTIEDYDRMLADQKGVCGICGGEDTHHIGRRLAVDHDARTRQVRGLLCRRCNQAIGAFDHDADLLRRAIIYLER